MLPSLKVNLKQLAECTKPLFGIFSATEKSRGPRHVLVPLFLQPPFRPLMVKIVERRLLACPLNCVYDKYDVYRYSCVHVYVPGCGYIYGCSCVHRLSYLRAMSLPQLKGIVSRSEPSEYRFIDVLFNTSTDPLCFYECTYASKNGLN